MPVSNIDKFFDTNRNSISGFLQAPGDWEKISVSETHFFVKSANTSKWFGYGISTYGGMGTGIDYTENVYLTGSLMDYEVIGNWDDLIAGPNYSYGLSAGTDKNWFSVGLNEYGQLGRTDVEPGGISHTTAWGPVSAIYDSNYNLINDNFIKFDKLLLSKNFAVGLSAGIPLYVGRNDTGGFGSINGSFNNFGFNTGQGFSLSTFYSNKFPPNQYGPPSDPWLGYDNNLIIVGSFTTFNGNTRRRILALDRQGNDITQNRFPGLSTGTPSSSYFSNIVYDFYADQVDPFGPSGWSSPIFVAVGNFTTVNGATNRRIYVMDYDTGDKSGAFDNSVGFSNSIYSVKSFVGAVGSVGSNTKDIYCIGELNNSYKNVAFGGVARIRLRGVGFSRTPGQLITDSAISLSGFPRTTFNELRDGYTDTENFGALLTLGGLTYTYEPVPQSQITIFNDYTPQLTSFPISATFIPYSNQPEIYTVKYPATGFYTELPPPGNILIGGNIKKYSNPNTFIQRDVSMLVCIDYEGYLNETFTNNLSNVLTGYNNPSNSYVKAIDVNPADGSILVGGSFIPGHINNFFTLNSNKRNLIKLNYQGIVDNNFNNSGILSSSYTSMPVNCIKRYSQNPLHYLIGGNFTNFREFSGFNRLAMLSSDGALVTNFNNFLLNPMLTGANGPVYAIDVDGSNRILVGGAFSYINGYSANNLARLLPDGTFDTLFNIDGTGFTLTVGGTKYVSSIKVLSTGNILVGGNFNRYNWAGALQNTLSSVNNCHGFVILNNSGYPLNRNNLNIPTFFSSNNNMNVNDIHLQDDGKIIISGAFDVISFNTYNGQFSDLSRYFAYAKSVRFYSNFSIDNSYYAAPDDTVYSVDTISRPLPGFRVTPTPTVPPGPTVTPTITPTKTVTPTVTPTATPAWTYVGSVFCVGGVSQAGRNQKKSFTYYNSVDNEEIASYFINTSSITFNTSFSSHLGPNGKLYDLPEIKDLNEYKKRNLVVDNSKNQSVRSIRLIRNYGLTLFRIKLDYTDISNRILSGVEVFRVRKDNTTINIPILSTFLPYYKIVEKDKFGGVNNLYPPGTPGYTLYNYITSYKTGEFFEIECITPQPGTNFYKISKNNFKKSYNYDWLLPSLTARIFDLIDNGAVAAPNTNVFYADLYVSWARWHEKLRKCYHVPHKATDFNDPPPYYVNTPIGEAIENNNNEYSFRFNNPYTSSFFKNILTNRTKQRRTKTDYIENISDKTFSQDLYYSGIYITYDSSDYDFTAFAGANDIASTFPVYPDGSGVLRYDTYEPYSPGLIPDLSEIEFRGFRGVRKHAYKRLLKNLSLESLSAENINPTLYTGYPEIHRLDIFDT